MAGQLGVAEAGGSVVTAEGRGAGLAAPLGRNHKKREKCWGEGKQKRKKKTIALKGNRVDHHSCAFK